MLRKVLCAGMLLCAVWTVAVQAEEEAESISIIGGADGPTSIFLAGKLGGEDAEEVQDDAAQNLYALKTKYVGDNTAVISIVTELAVNGYLPPQNNTYIIQSEEEPYGLTISYEEELSEETDEIFLKMMDSGNILLALIENLSKIEFTFPVSKGEEVSTYTLYWDTEAANTSLNGDVKEYGESLEKFSELIGS